MMPRVHALRRGGGVGVDQTVVRRPLLETPSDYVLAGVLLLAGLATVGTWATGQLAGLLFTGTWPGVSVGEGFGIATRLPEQWNDPRQAWPAEVHADLPGQLGFTIAASLVLLAAGVCLMLLVRWSGQQRQVRGFASPAQLRAALSSRSALAKAGRLRPDLPAGDVRVADVAVDLGRAGRHHVVGSIENSVLLLAAPRQGKTSQVIIPWLHAWPGPALVTSVRTDVVLNTLTLRRVHGPVAVMDLSGTTWPHPLAWSPVAGCAAFDVARRRADVMVTVGKAETGPTDSTNAGFFGLTATNLLAGWLHTAALTGRSMDDVLAWALDERLDEPIRLLREHPGAARIAAMLDNIYRSPIETRSNMWTTVLTAVAPLLSQAARAVFCPPAGQGQQGFDIQAFLRSRGTVYLLVPEQQAADLAPLVSVFVDEITQAAGQLAATTEGGRLDPPLGMFLDEAANVVPLPHLPALMSYAGGSGIFVTTVLQDIAQARHRWGRDGADMLWGAATIKIALGGLGGDELTEFAKLAGHYRESLTTSQYGTHGSSLQTTLTDRPVITAKQVRTLSADRHEALIVHATTAPVITRMTRHYQGPHARAYARAVTDARDLLTAGWIAGGGDDGQAAGPSSSGGFRGKR